MRRLPKRPLISKRLATKLKAKTAEIMMVPEQQRAVRARQLFKGARGAKWMAEAVEALRKLCGPAELCMYCSSNEPSQLEHYRPVAAAPEDCFAFTNYLWVCDICNRAYKRDRFPPETEAGEQILNPLDDDVWEYFLIEPVFGRLVPHVRPNGEPLGRAKSTQEVVGLSREYVQMRRQRLYRDLRDWAMRTLEGHRDGQIARDRLREQINDWLSTPFQADVPDYFLRGPGSDREPFRSILAMAQV